MEKKTSNEYDLSIVIVSYNCCQLITKCIESIYQFTENLRIQIIVSDNNSKDNTIETIEDKFPKVIILKNGANLGFGAANNRALTFCQGPFILFLNPDIIFIEPVLTKIIEFMQKHEEAGLVGCKLVNPDNSIQKSFLNAFPTLTNRFLEAIYVEKLLNKYKKPIKDDIKNVAAIVGACMFTRKHLIKKLNGFDESYFMYCEDIDLCYRVKQIGYNIYYFNNFAMFHHLGATTKKNKKSYFSKVLIKESVYKYFAKHHGKMNAELYRILMILGAIIRLWMLLILGPFNKVLQISYDVGYANSVLNYLKVISWGLGFEKWAKKA